MAGSNPYYVRGEDDDLFEQPAADDSTPTASPGHALDGSACYSCGKIHNLSLPPGTPPEVIERLSEFIDKLPDQAVQVIVTAENSLSMKLMHDFLSFAVEVDTANRNGPFFRAIAELVDDMAGGGKVGPLIKFYGAEQTIIGTHVVKNALLSLRKKLDKDLDKNNQEEVDKNQPIFDSLDRILSTADLRMENAVDQYMKLAEETGNIIDQKVIDSGVYGEEASYFASRMIQIPLLKIAADNEDDKDEDEEPSEEDEETSP